MTFNLDLWQKALKLEKEFQKRGESFGRGNVSEALKVSESLARNICWALQNKDIIKLNPNHIDGVNEQITHDRTGFFVPAGDTDHLTRAARQLLRNTAGLAEIGAAAGRHAETHWTLQAFLDRHERLYRDILDRTDRPSRTESQGERARKPGSGLRPRRPP